MHRLLIGIIALGLLATAGVLYAQGLAQEYVIVLSGCLRMGMVLGAIWLAYDQVHEIIRRTPPWLIGAIGLSLVVVVVRPRAILALGPLLAGAVALHYLGRLLKP
ncbi:MAG: hypothetical protein GXP26_15775 [Planctomycetes bacterium]|nr:hypothetical protein [Planctomycetota bacterium]